MFRLILCLLTVFSTCSSNTIKRNEISSDFWTNEASDHLKMSILDVQPNMNNAKNVIIFIGDGMGISTITAARIYLGQKQGNSGEEAQLTFEKFPFVALSKTYNVDKQVPDSAGTATAIFSGVKTNYQTLGVSPKVKVKDCKSVAKNELSSVLEWSQNAGKKTGIVTTTRVTHATPAALYSHTAFRDWESDADMVENVTDKHLCKDIARQLMEDLPGLNVKVILGGGRKNFEPENSTNSHDGVRLDGIDLINKWKEHNVHGKFVTNSKQLEKAIREPGVDELLGLFNKDHMNYELDRDKSDEGEPSLSSMTKAAITVLGKSQKGFFLMVEGGRIDHAHHENNAKRALEDTVAMNEAVQTAVKMTSQHDTLIVVTADHSHTLVINGYPDRGTPILGKADAPGIVPNDNMPYTTLMYTTGNAPYNWNATTRRNLTSVNTEMDNFTQDAQIPMNSETHGGEDVAVFAVGPMAHLFHGVIEQNYIAHVMAYASCVGKYSKRCMTTNPSTKYNAATTPYTTFLISVFSTLVSIFFSLSNSFRMLLY